MKIVCDNCSAKYSIADEKVAGKVFKIRCKKCTNVIVVRGDQLGAEQQEAAPAQGFDYGGEAVWHVVIDGDQQGPYAPAQIGQLLTDGTIDWEAYVWREGFDGWKPARDVPELVAAVTGDPSHAEAAAAAPAAADPMAATAAGDPMGADPFAAAGDAFGGGGAFEGAPTEAAREAPGGDAGADLFAQADAGGSPFGGVDDDVVASAASPRVSTEDAMTGQRNENSVLFSLSNLQALATGGGGGDGPSPAPSGGGGGGAPPPGHASGEGSGLIDIRALASATASTGGPSAPAASSGGASDLLSIGGGGGLGSSLGAPVLAPAAPEPEKNNKTMIIGVGVAAVMVVGLLVALIVVLTQKPEPVAQASNPSTTEATTDTTVTPAVDPASMDMPAAGAPITSEMEAAETTMDDEEPETNNGSSSHMRRRDRGMRTSQASTMSDDPLPEAMTMRSMASGSIDDLLNQALGGMMSSSMMTAAAASSMLPPQPSRDDVGRALRGVSSRVGGCGNGTSGVANAAITFASSGRVRSVRVTGVPPAVQSCVARTVRSARVSPFSRPTFNVNFPFRVR